MDDNNSQPPAAASANPEQSTTVLDASQAASSLSTLPHPPPPPDAYATLQYIQAAAPDLSVEEIRHMLYQSARQLLEKLGEFGYTTIQDLSSLFDHADDYYWKRLDIWDSDVRFETFRFVCKYVELYGEDMIWDTYTQAKARGDSMYDALETIATSVMQGIYRQGGGDAKMPAQKLSAIEVTQSVGNVDDNDEDLAKAIALSMADQQRSLAGEKRKADQM